MAIAGVPRMVDPASNKLLGYVDIKAPISASMGVTPPRLVWYGSIVPSFVASWHSASHRSSGQKRIPLGTQVVHDRLATPGRGAWLLCASEFRTRWPAIGHFFR